MKPSSRLAALATLFLFSGAIALVYEIVWQRQFALLLGSAAPATAAVLAAYFTGLGTGSLLLGRLARRWPNPLRTYAVLEVLIAVGALGTCGLFPALARIYPSLHASLAEAPAAFFAAKLGLAFVAIALPTFCMGGTLPVLGRLVDGQHRNLGVTAGLLYATNTAGAGLGALSAPFFLLPWLGVNGALALCIGGNLALAAWAWRLSRRASYAAATANEKPVADVPRAASSPTPTLSSNALYTLAIASGAATFALQVLWNRAFAQVHENSVHSFAVIVAAVIFALALGAQLARTALRRGLTPSGLVAASWGLAGLVVAVGPWLFLWLTDGLAYLPADQGYARRLLGLTAATVLLPMTLLGVGLPALLDEAGRHTRQDVSLALGRVLAMNIAGAVVGALLAGFFLPRWLGLWGGLVLTGVLLTLGGVSLLVPRGANREHGSRTSRFVILTNLALVTVFLAVMWAAAKLNLPRVRIDAQNGERIMSLAEGTHGITAVTERSGSRRLKLNNHYLLGGTSSTGDERLQAHLPLLLHTAPRQVAFLGVGTGISASGALFHPVEQLTAIELVPEVIAAAREHFATANGGVLDHLRTRVIVDDARNFLRGTRATFDVIIGDLVVPWRQGEGALFTVESFAAARARLAPGGLFCQWVPCFQLTEPEVRIVLRTFLEVFPEALVLRGDFSPKEPALGLIGWTGDRPDFPDRVRARLATMARDLANPHLTQPDIYWMHFAGVLARADVTAWTDAINSDNHPVIELPGGRRYLRARPTPIVGRSLQTFLAATFTRGPDPLNLTAVDRAGWEAGDIFAEMMLRIAEGAIPRARETQARLKSTLPEASYQLLFPERPLQNQPEPAR